MRFPSVKTQQDAIGAARFYAAQSKPKNAAADDLAQRTPKEKNRWQVKLAEFIGPEECPMMRRWIVVSPLGSVRLHHFLRGDNDRQPHDHPWWFVTLVLRGGYTDLTQCHVCLGSGSDFGYWSGGYVEGEWINLKCATCNGRGELEDVLRPGSVRFRPVLHRHRVQTSGSWSVVVTGRNARQWGFWEGRLFTPAAEFFRRYGYAACE